MTRNYRLSRKFSEGVSGALTDSRAAHMKITLLYSLAADLGLGLERIIKTIVDVLTELGLTVKEIDLQAYKLPCFDGKTNAQAADIVKDIRDSAGVIFASAARLPAIPAPFAVFLDYLTLPEYADVLDGKNCFLLIASGSGGERSSLESLSRALQGLRAYDCVSAGLQRPDVDNIAADENYRGIFEKIIEDFYRIIRQNRRFFIPLDYPRGPAGEVGPIIQAEWETAEDPEGGEAKSKISLDDLTRKLNLDKLDENQADDINEISDYFNKVMSEHHQTDNASPVYVQSLGREDLSRAPESPSSCRQLTKSLTHHFQPQLSHNLNAVIQLQISGEETFAGLLTVQNTECVYADGASPNPDITIITDAAVWRDVCLGKYSAQKAFMIGRLKVRGNFVLLTKFDHLFHLNP